MFRALAGFLLAFLLAPLPALAATPAFLTPSEAGLPGFVALGLFTLAYGLVLAEEKTGLRKSKPVTVAAGLIWLLVFIAHTASQQAEIATVHIREALIDYSELMLFLLAAMTYVNTMEERGIFLALRAKLISSGLSLRALYWTTGTIAFFLSPIADNLTTALILGAVAISVGKGSKRFIAGSCVSIVVAANAGGAFSPFGDITTLMVWQKGFVPFFDFFRLFLPSLISWLIPAYLIGLTVPTTKPNVNDDRTRVRKGGFVVVGLFLLTITMTVVAHQTLHIPPFLSMMTGFSFLKIYGYFIREDELRLRRSSDDTTSKPFDIFISLKHIEWDTLLFFYGVMMSIAGLQALGYLSGLAHIFYGTFSETTAHTLIGIVSALLGNVPVTLAVLNMDIPHSLGQWLLVTLTAGIGGSLLSIGSAAGVALMGQAKENYTFLSHLKFAWTILLGYFAAIALHCTLNGELF